MGAIRDLNVALMQDQNVRVEEGPMHERLLLSVHVAVSAVALVAGLLAMAARKRQGHHTRFGTAYFIAVSAVSVTGAMLALADWKRNGAFLGIAVITQALATLGFVATGRPGRKWLTAHAVGMVGSYVEITGAFLVNNWVYITGRHGRESPEAFLIPGALGTLALIWLAVGILRGRLPRSGQVERVWPRHRKTGA